MIMWFQILQTLATLRNGYIGIKQGEFQNGFLHKYTFKVDRENIKFKDDASFPWNEMKHKTDYAVIGYMSLHPQ
jgi:hypothetical protein